MSTINIPTGKGGGDIDLVCYDSETLFYVELKHGKTDILAQFDKFLRKRNNDLHFLKNNFDKTKTKIISDVKYFFFIPSIFQSTEKKLKENLKGQPNQEKVFILRNLIASSNLSVPIPETSEVYSGFSKETPT